MDLPLRFKMQGKQSTMWTHSDYDIEWDFEYNVFFFLLFKIINQQRTLSEEDADRRGVSSVK